jgi:Fe-S oxidoreductase
MARLKSEFLNAWNERHGLPLRSRLFGNLGTLTRAGSRVAPLVNTVSQWGGTRRLSEAVLGVARERGLPRLARHRFSRWFAGHPPATTGDDVVLFLDTYTETMAPEIGIAAVEVLEAAGCRVVIAEGQGCCGRPMISNGMLRQARAAAARNLAALGDYADAGAPIVGLEPSCLLTLRDEYLEFFPSDERSSKIAARAVLIEEFLVRPGADGAKPIDRLLLEGTPHDVTLHGHCYTKSLVGSAPMLEMLGRISSTVEEIPSGCCGMAGSFGYEREHYGLSRKIAEMVLLPAVREADAAGRVVAAAGMSCRGQIFDGSGARALHPIELVAARLRRPPAGS